MHWCRRRCRRSPKIIVRPAFPTRAYGVSLAYVSECVRAQTGRTYKELLQKHRMETAARLLRRSDLNIQQIIAQVGYENTSYFYRLFHERYGQSPREYRRARSQRT